MKKFAIVLDLFAKFCLLVDFLIGRRRGKRWTKKNKQEHWQFQECPVLKTIPNLISAFRYEWICFPLPVFVFMKFSDAEEAERAELSSPYISREAWHSVDTWFLRKVSERGSWVTQQTAEHGGLIMGCKSTWRIERTNICIRVKMFFTVRRVHCQHHCTLYW